MELGLHGRAVVVGGASRGLGRAVAMALAVEGCRLMLWSRGGERLEETAREVRAARRGAQVHTIGADASDPDAPQAVADATLEALGRADVLVLNAGGPPPVDSSNTDPEEWRRSLQLLAITPIELATRLLPGMRAAGWGRIVGILSSTIRQPVPNLVYSTAGRSALAAWMKTTAAAVAGEGVTINGVLPGRLDTDRVKELDRALAEGEGGTYEQVRARSEGSIPAGRYGDPAELAAVVTFLCSERASYVTGAFLPVDGGLIQVL